MSEYYPYNKHLCDALAPTEVSLTAIRCEIQSYIPHEKFVGEISCEWHHDLNRMAVRLERHVWSERLGDESVRWPATWWDAVKDRWFPGWLQRRYPVRWKHAEFTVYRGYPDLMFPSHKSALFLSRSYR